WGGPTGQIIRYNRYYLEDKPQYLDDERGEFWFERRDAKKGSGRLYLRLPDGLDPNRVRLEVARRIRVIYGERMDHIEISGLTFRFTNVYWDLAARPWVSRDVEPACIRLWGSGTGITVRNCRFEHVHSAIRLRAVKVSDRIDRVMICDNVIRMTDHAGMELFDGGGWGRKDREVGRLLDVKILRNKLELTGMRPDRFGQGHAMVVECAQTLEVAGNFLYRVYGSGIHVFGAKRSMLRADRPLSRILIHHNKVVDSLLNTNDWGGIETWQGGPAYVYCNISGNPGGYWHWKYKNHPQEPGCGRFGHAYYLDGAFKNYLFNNIAWGKSKDPLSPLGNTSAFQEIVSYQNTFFNNTVYNFVVGSRRQAAHAGRDKFLGNVWEGIGLRVFRHAQPAKAAADANAKDAGKVDSRFDYGTNAFARNVFHDVAEYGVYLASGLRLKRFSEFQDALKRTRTLVAELGVESDKAILKDPAAFDFRPRHDSLAIDRGVRVFVPWALYATVGEWHFYHRGGDVSEVIDEHWYMTPFHQDRKEYYKLPSYPLQVKGVSEDDYVNGILEDWVKGALRLNGKGQYAVWKQREGQSGTKNPEKPEAFAKEPCDWAELVNLPSALSPEKAAQIEIRLRGAAATAKGILQVDLHQIRKDGKWGGLNT
ncbi:MAG: hypothetical protein D6820_15080, partial [Lentisphaerae bacterium]